MITVTVNGEKTPLEESAVVADILEKEGLDPEHARGVAVAVNDRVVRRSEWASRGVSDSDRVEIVTARQGG